MTTSVSSITWIIGYGNIQRRDDGAGPFVVDGLKRILKHKKNLHLLSLVQLEADLVERLSKADFILFVDATIENLDGGRAWSRIYPETKILPYLTHHIDPTYLLGLIDTIYGRSLPAWTISIQGFDFGFKEGLCPETEKTAEKVIAEIIQFIDNQSLVE